MAWGGEPARLMWRVYVHTMLSRLRSRLSSAHLIALVALFVALGSTASAAVVITGRQVKDGSLTGRDIKDRSLTGSDIKDRSLTARDLKPGSVPVGKAGAPGPKGAKGAKGDKGAQGLKGDTGAQGVEGAVGAQGNTGLQGPKGDTGPRGPSRAIVRDGPGQLIHNSEQLMDTIVLDEGSYLLFSRAKFENQTGGDVLVACHLYDLSGGQLDEDLLTMVVASSGVFRATSRMETPLVVPAGETHTVQLKCNNATNANLIVGTGSRIEALQVGSIE